MILKGSFHFILQFYIFHTVLVDLVFANTTKKPLNESCEVPGPVRSFHVISVTSNSVKLGWIEPTGFQRCFVGYELSWSIYPGHIINQILKSYRTSYATFSLKPCTNYTFSIVAFNVENKRNSTNVPNITVQTAPAKVSRLQTTHLPSSITVTWEQPLDGLSCATGHYELEYNTYFPAKIVSPAIPLEINQTSYIINNLKPCIFYVIYIVTKGTQIDSRAWTISQASPEAPGPVESFKVTYVTSNQVTLKWSKPTKNSECVRRYEIEWSKYNDSLKHGPFSLWFMESNYTIHKLTPCTNFIFSIQATHGYMMSNQTNLSTTTAAVVPGTVRNLQVANITNSSLKITWEKPLFGLSCANHYLLYYTDKHGTSQIIEIDLNKTSYTINNLSSIDEYKIAVTTIGMNEDSITVFVAKGSVKKLGIFNIQSLFLIAISIRHFIFLLQPV